MLFIHYYKIIEYIIIMFHIHEACTHMHSKTCNCDTCAWQCCLDHVRCNNIIKVKLCLLARYLGQLHACLSLTALRLWNIMLKLAYIVLRYIHPFMHSDRTRFFLLYIIIAFNNYCYITHSDVMRASQQHLIIGSILLQCIHSTSVVQ